MKTPPPTAVKQLNELSPTLTQVTESLHRRNDSLQLHLVQSGWVIRRMDPRKPTSKGNSNGSKET